MKSILSATLLLMGFKLMAGAVASCALIGVAVFTSSMNTIPVPNSMN